MRVEMRKEDIHHGHKVGELSMKIGEYLELNNKTCIDLYKAGLLHDYGKALISQSLLNKKGPLTNREYEIVKQHAVNSAKIVQKLGYNDYIVRSILYHHEDFSGTGYNKIKGNDITFGARILRVADMYSALVEDRVYRKAYTNEKAIEIMEQHIKCFDPVIYKVLKNIVGTKKEVIGGVKR